MMPLSPDQQATLQLLLEREQTYADIAAVLGGDTDQVRSRARAALTELVGADPDRNVGLTDYLLGQADPIGRADAVRHLRDDPGDHRLAVELSATLRDLFPQAELPRLPGEPRPVRARALRSPGAPAPEAPPAGAPATREPGGALSAPRTRIVAVAGIAAVLIIGVVLALAGAFGGDDADGGGTADEPSETATTTPDEELERVALSPVGGGDASGRAVFGLATGDQAFVDVSIRGLDPAPNGQQYVIWLMLTEEEGYPLSPITVTQQGTFTDRFAIPAAVLPLVARVRFVDVSIAPTREIARLVARAIQDTKLVLTEPGEIVLRGEIPRAEAGGGA